MSTTSPASPHPVRYRPGLAWFTVAGSVWVFVLVTLGAFTTTIGAGMVFPDWPLSNGSLNPEGWLNNLSMFAEHSHRLSAGMMSIITIGIAVWLQRTETRRWLRRLGWFAVGLVLVQAVVGGLRVLLDNLQVEMVDTSVGRLFAMLHACLAQFYVCNLIAIAAACSRPWLEKSYPVGPWVRRLGVICCGLLFVQLAIAAVVRHSFAWVTIPTFPYSTPEGDWLPQAWNFRVAIHFAHRVMALILAVALVLFAGSIRLDRQTSLFMRAGAMLVIALLANQIALGAAIIWTQRSPGMTTGHVLVGALTLATTFWLTWMAHRDRLAQLP